ncbi:MAG: OmpA family protein [Patescibacteria group bacterium]|nr:OmpA family protein [Patescibacteria group bacterium]
MMTSCRVVSLFLLGCLPGLSGCLFVPITSYRASETQNRNLTDLTRAQATELENLRVHALTKEDQVLETERSLARMEEEMGVNRHQLDGFRREREQLHRQFEGLTSHFGHVPPDVGRQLTELSSRFPSLQFDAETGLSKFDSDILFDSGEAELKPEAEKVLGELARVLNSPEGKELRILVAGHTDDQRIAGRPSRDEHPTNFHLSTARAHAVAEVLRGKGIDDHRVGVAGFGAHQPIAPNGTSADRRKNRRVEVFVLAPNVPVVGWTETIPRVYR